MYIHVYICKYIRNYINDYFTYSQQHFFKLNLNFQLINIHIIYSHF